MTNIQALSRLLLGSAALMALAGPAFAREYAPANNPMSPELAKEWQAQNPGPLTLTATVGEKLTLGLGEQGCSKKTMHFDLEVSGPALDKHWTLLKGCQEHYARGVVKAVKPGIGHAKVFYTQGSFKRHVYYLVADLTIEVLPKGSSPTASAL
jgi:hypothetical protein